MSNQAQAACDALLEKFKLQVGDRYFKAQFTTIMVPLIYIKYSGVKRDSKPSELMAAKHQVQYMIYGFNIDGSIKDQERQFVTASPSTADNKLNNITGTLDYVMSEIGKVLDKYV
jgi:hypothetical protein